MKTNETPIPVLLPKVPSWSQVRKYVERVDASRTYSNFGALVIELQERLADYFAISATNVATASNATLALEGAIATAEVAPSARACLPSWTFTATAAAVLRTRGGGHFCDVDDMGRILEPSGDCLVIETLPFGADYTERSHAAAPRIIDGAASFDALRGAGKNLTGPTLVVVSLHATKCLPAGEGSIVFSNDERWIGRFRQWTNFGMWGSRTSTTPGTNAKMSEYSAAVALSSLDEWPVARTEWLSQAERAKALTAHAKLRPHMAMHDGHVTPYWIVSCRTDEERGTLQKIFSKNGIGTRSWWEHGCHTMPAYLSFSRGDLQQTERFAGTTLGLPMYREMSAGDWTRIEGALGEFEEWAS